MSTVAIVAPRLAAPPQAVPLEDIDKVVKYTSKSISAQAQRAIEYAKEERVVLRFARNCAQKIALGGLLGAGGGALMGIPGGPAVMVKLAAKGMAAGVAIATPLSLIHEVVEIRNSEDYHHWLVTSLSDKVIPVYQQFISANRLPTCPLSLDLIRIPYQCKHGRTFEYSEVVKFFRTKKEQAEARNAALVQRGEKPIHSTEKFLCPGGRNPSLVTDDDLDSWGDFSYNEGYHKGLIEELRGKSVENPEIAAAFERYSQGVINHHIELVVRRNRQDLASMRTQSDREQAKQRLNKMVDDIYEEFSLKPKTN